MKRPSTDFVSALLSVVVEVVDHVAEAKTAAAAKNAAEIQKVSGCPIMRSPRGVFLVEFCTSNAFRLNEARSSSVWKKVFRENAVSASLPRSQPQMAEITSTEDLYKMGGLSVGSVLWDMT